MCGLVALFRRSGKPVTKSELVAMREILHHRGPDDTGLFLEKSVGLGFCRLKVIDLQGGHQPMINQAGTVMACSNNVRKYSGSGTTGVMPVPNAAFETGSGANLEGALALVAAGATSNDSEVWFPAGN